MLLFNRYCQSLCQRCGTGPGSGGSVIKWQPGSGSVNSELRIRGADPYYLSRFKGIWEKSLIFYHFKYWYQVTTYCQHFFQWPQKCPCGIRTWQDPQVIGLLDQDPLVKIMDTDQKEIFTDPPTLLFITHPLHSRIFHLLFFSARSFHLSKLCTKLMCLCLHAMFPSFPN